MKKYQIEIDLSNGYKLVAEQNLDPSYNREMLIGIVNPHGVWCQDLAIIRNSYRYENNELVWNDKQFDVLVYGSENDEDFTDDFSINLHEESE
ncbi:hypothetical protein [Bacteroides acidifaciens]|uniref:hypothetical protein n=1 Tax=Bacteroides acidifaciens TaxID=85831 RepID=UPI00248B4322|nr:hypothetical protein [Bacteroides acidifaciens]